MDKFTPIPSLVGGILIGLSASILLLFTGKVAGVSGIVGGLLRRPSGDTLWRACFIAGLMVGGSVIAVSYPQALRMELTRSAAAHCVAGLLVGFGTRLGAGCTSGHGVCGISRLSVRSIVATITFMAVGAISVFVINQIFGGSL
jgi:uncharacterized membrane protein YedE/YeeE